jgi:hypothetical protein
MKHQIGDDNPTKHDKPVLDQPPPLLEIVSGAFLEQIDCPTYWNVVNTSFAGA